MRYHSTANPYPIYAWSRPLFWSVAMAVAVILWIGTSIIDCPRPKELSATV